MFSFFKRTKNAGKNDPVTEIAEPSRKNETSSSVTAKRAHGDYETNDKSNTLRKDVVNLLIPETDYNQKSGVGAILQHIMAGNRKKRNRKKNIIRAESCREISPQKEMQNVNLQRSRSEVDPSYKYERDDAPATKNTFTITAHEQPDDADPANFVKALVLQKYANKSPVQPKKGHVSLVYVSDEPDIDEKKRAETLLREIARSIDCTLDDTVMGANDSKAADRPRVVGRNERWTEPVYETVEEPKNDSIKSIKDDLKEELAKLLQEQKEAEIKNDIKDYAVSESDNKPLPDILESPVFKKKSNLKIPKSDNEGCSDDDRSDCGKKKVTFRKHIVFDDGDQQTDEEVDSSFETISSEGSEEDEEIEIEEIEEIEEEEEEEEEDEEKTDDNTNIIIEEPKESQVDIKLNDQHLKDNIINSDSSIKIKIECNNNDGLKRISSDNSDSGFLEISDKQNGSSDDLISVVKSLSDSGSGSDSEESEEEVTISEEEEEVIAVIFEPEEYRETPKSLVSQETKFQSQVAQLTELADARCGESDRMRDQICRFRKEIEAKDLEIEHLKCELAAAYKESELIRQRSRSLEEDLSAARSCSADLADRLSEHNDITERQLRSELDATLTRAGQLESRVLALERDRDRLEREKRIHEQKAQEALTAAEANTAKWRAAHESARSQAAARAERMLADCEWKMRELEKKARESDKQNNELTKTIEQLKSEKSSEPSAEHMAELHQLRGVASERQRSVQSLTLQLQRVETREEALKLEVHRLKELLEKEKNEARIRDEKHTETVQRLEQHHTKTVETMRTEHQQLSASTRAALERTHAERTRAALAQLRADAERDAKNADRKLREVTTRFENLKETLQNKESYFERAIAEAHSKADWELLQLRHLLDKSDITYANNLDKINEKFEDEKEKLIEEWSEKLKNTEQEATQAADEAKKILDTTRAKLTAEMNDQVNRLKEQHRKEMEEQWERFMSDKESCLARMKTECRQEGEEERYNREKILLEEIAELKSQIQCKSTDLDTLSAKTAQCGRTLAVTEQELREALARERDLRGKRSEDATKIKQAERASKDQVDHLTRKCACLRKLFDDMRNRLSEREKAAEQQAKGREKELHQLRAEVARLTKLLMEQGSPKLGTRTRADGCDSPQVNNESFLVQAVPPASDNQPTPPRRKGGTLRTPEFLRKRTNLPELAPLPPELRPMYNDLQDGRRRARSVDLPAVQVPVRIKQLEERQQ